MVSKITDEEIEYINSNIFPLYSPDSKFLIIHFKIEYGVWEYYIKPWIGENMIPFNKFYCKSSINDKFRQLKIKSKDIIISPQFIHIFRKGFYVRTHNDAIRNYSKGVNTMFVIGTSQNWHACLKFDNIKQFAKAKLFLSGQILYEK